MNTFSEIIIRNCQCTFFKTYLEFELLKEYFRIWFVGVGNCSL